MINIRTIPSFFDWWGTELKALVRAGLRRLLGLERATLVVRLEGRTVEAHLENHLQRTPIAATEVTPEDWGDLGTNFARALQVIDPGSVETTLQISATHVVRRHLRLPPTPERDLAGLLSFEIERHTPFKPDEAYFSYLRRDGDGEATDVAITVAPRRIVDPLIARLTQIGFSPNHVVLGDDNQRSVLGLGARRPRGRAQFATAALALLLVAAAVSPLLRLEIVAENLTAALDMARRDAGVQAGDSASRVLVSARFIDEQRRQRPSPLAVLNDLATLLPDGTWLVQFGQTGRDVTLEGQTDSSANLIPRLEASPRFSAVSYDAPVTKNSTGRGERFTFSLQIAQDNR
ncbi:MAG: PilN domain-containing protein [Proteobacteria bacterium]|nr:PilN domain-containing protein [Pseudomonadota bacterium]MDA1060115.1 PilN domain-containing protein [Pseudomonadota bacterium]